MIEAVIPHISMEELQGLVQQHRVCYEVWPEWLMVEDKKVQIGFEIELCGVHECDGNHDSPACQLCYQTFDDLKRVAEWLVAESGTTARCEILPYDDALHESPKRRFRPEIVLTIKILHRHDHQFDAPVDQSEELCLKQLREKLAGIGVAEGIWFPRDKQEPGPS